MPPSRPIAASLAALAAATLVLAGAARADVRPFPASFHERDVAVADGSTLHVRIGGQGPAVLLLHGFGDTGDMWAPLAERLAADHTVIVPDLRGMGLSSHPVGGYDKASEARDLNALLDALHIDKLQLVTHDIGNMVGFALAEERLGRVTRWVVMDAPVPGLGHWDDQLKNPKTWHFNFRGPDVERLVAGRERILLDRFYDDLSADPSRIDEATRAHYAALYARPQAIHDSFEQFAAFPTDAADNQAFIATNGRLTMPVLAIGGSASYGPQLAAEMLYAAADVRRAVVQNSGHWLMEEQPDATMALILPFLAEPDAAR
jgi:pimeloyl-ACP methyl ester carboxylesterase